MTEKEKFEQQHQADLLRIQNFRLLDDDFMTKCFDGEPACTELVLQIILNRPDLHVIDVHTQVFVANLLKRSVRLDVLAIDSSGHKYDIEVQRADKGACQRRARFNSSMMDAKWTEKGTDFNDLPETFTIFITENDVIGEGQALYRVERCILGSGRLFEDGAHIIYVNGSHRDETPIGKLMHDFSCQNADDMYYDILAKRVRFFKESEEGVAAMSKAFEEVRMESYQEGRLEGRLEGIQEGARKRAIENAKAMLRRGKLTLEEIAEDTGLTSEEIYDIRREMGPHPIN